MSYVRSFKQCINTTSGHDIYYHSRIDMAARFGPIHSFDRLNDDNEKGLN